MTTGDLLVLPGVGAALLDRKVSGNIALNPTPQSQLVQRGGGGDLVSIFSYTDTPCVPYGHPCPCDPAY